MARRRRSAPSVRPGLRPVRRRSAPWPRRRRTGRSRDPRTRRRNRHVRRVAPDARARRDHPDGGRLCRHARPPRHDRRREGRVRRRRLVDRDDGVERDARARRAERPPRRPSRERRRRIRRPARAPPAPGGSRACATPGAAGPRTDAGPCPGPRGRTARRIAAPTTGRAWPVDGTSVSGGVRARRTGPTCCRRVDTRSGQRSDRRELASDVPRSGGRVLNGAWSGRPARAAGAHDLREGRSSPTAPGGRSGYEPARCRRCPSRRARRRRLRGRRPERAGSRRRCGRGGDRPGRRRLDVRPRVARGERLSRSAGFGASDGVRGPRCVRPDRANSPGSRRRASGEPRGDDRVRSSDTRDPRRWRSPRPTRGGVPPRVPPRSGGDPERRP